MKDLLNLLKNPKNQKSLSSLPIRALAGVLVVLGAVLFFGGAIFATSLLTFLSIVSVALGGVVAVIAFLISKFK